jgi:hypothetical protein
VRWIALSALRANSCTDLIPAVEVNIQIMRAFVQLRQILSSQEQFHRKPATLERRLTEHYAKLVSVFEAIR